VLNQEKSAPESKSRIRRSSAETSPFDDLASDYDAWFDGEGKVIFAIEVRVLQQVLPSLPEPWLEVGVGSGRFAEALGIKTGIDPSVNLVGMARKRGITVLLGRGEQQIFGAASFGTVFLIVTLCFLDSVADVLKEVYRILIADGKIVLGLVSKESPWGEFYKKKKRQVSLIYSIFHSKGRVDLPSSSCGQVISLINRFESASIVVPFKLWRLLFWLSGFRQRPPLLS